jgi:hypothetical protein
MLRPPKKARCRRGNFALMPALWSARVQPALSVWLMAGG